MPTNTNSPLPQFVSIGEALTDLIRVDGEQWLSKTGGSDWNVARVMANFGVSTGFAGAISQDWFGDALFAASTAANLDLRFLQRVNRPPLLAIVYETSPPQYNFIGENSADLAFDPTALPANWQQVAKWAHFGGISLAREPLAARLVDLASSLKQAGVKISYDPNFRNLMDERYDATLEKMAKLADVIKVSDEDLCGLFRTDDQVTALKKLRSFNPEAAVLLTLGAEGAAMLVGDQKWHVKPPAIDIVDTVGAGDAGIAGLIYALIQEAQQSSSTNIDWHAHLRFSVACGSAACLNAGPKPPQLEQVLALLD
ncbi:carbohydrate kinase family protein [Glaciimonas soli]|uniref:Carbohydrate kinase n=1 Tax=Glaciimonas soli TaxID=2590999 RepID=A0A843YUS4_9BURK|nr:carbohydrate kinase [Glaciimonas soli]MQR01454.1 carbohydrate kinase [Glaciimonas soli]